jgi:hypothetical protein
MFWVSASLVMSTPKEIDMFTKLTKALVAALVLAGVSLSVASTASAAPRSYQGECAHFTDGSTNCGFATFRQCQADVSGVGGICSQNPA